MTCDKRNVPRKKNKSAGRIAQKMASQEAAMRTRQNTPQKEGISKYRAPRCS